jgi:subtilisin family serine protease
MKHCFVIRRLGLLFVFLLRILEFQSFAQIGLVVQLPPTANIDNVAAHANGVVIDVLPDAGQFLLSVPAAPGNLPSNDVRWWELNQGTTLPSAPHAAYLTVSSTAATGWYSTQPAFALIHLQDALSHSTGQGVVVADINSRVDTTHPALAGHLTSGYDFVVGKPVGVASLNDSSANYLDDSSANYLDSATIAYLNDSSANYLDDSSANYLDGQNPAYSHGTLTAGIIAAISPGAIIMPLRVFDDNGSSSTFMIARAIRYAVNNGARVINMSFGTLTDTAVLRSAVAYAQSHNVILTASAGNDNTNAPQYPAAYSGVITTAATNLQDVKAPFSNYGTPVYIDAPGVNIISAVPNGLYGIVNGTSFSAPIAAGTAALLIAAGAADPASQMANAAMNIDNLNPQYTGQLGYGRIDILNSLTPY